MTPSLGTHGPVSVAALLTCHNRRDGTLACLERLFDQDCLSPKADGTQCLRLEVYLVDDGSNDGTSEQVHERHPQVRIIRGSGDLYWARGMRKAWLTAEGMEQYDAFLLLNDDTLLFPGALTALLATSAFMRRQHGNTGIAVGSILDENGRHHYGGSLWWSGRAPVIPGEVPKPCELFNCNATLVSADAYRILGGFSEVFTHAMADYEYAARAVRDGVPCYVASGYVGSCTRNPTPEWLDRNTPMLRRWRVLQTPKGLPFRQYRHLCRALYPWWWPLPFVATYLRLMLPSLRRHPSVVDVQRDR